MTIQSIIQGIASVANVFSVLVVAAGYYFTIRLYREWVHLRQQTRVAGGRPIVVVTADYSHLPEVSVVVRNFTDAPAKDLSFDFSAPVESSGGLILSDLPYFSKGLPFLEPQGRISCRWDTLASLMPVLKAKGCEDGIRVTTRYKDLAGESYESEWTLHPLLFEGAPIQAELDMNDLVDTVGKVPEEFIERDGRRAAPGGGRGSG